MRKSLILLPLLICASPAWAKPAEAPMIDPAVADRLASAVQTLSTSLLDLRVGGVEAAIEGREATPDEKRLTVRDLARRDDPDFDRKMEQGIAQAKPMMRQGMKALNEALPAMMQSLERARKSFERAMANMPDPTYPKR